MRKLPRLRPRMPYPDRRPYVSPATGRRRRSIPDRIAHYYIPLAVLETTDRMMRRFGQEERECYVWWGGYFTAEGAGQVVTALCPEVATTFGRIHLNLGDLTVLHAELRALDQVLLAELHTHPPRAGGQNEVDAAHPAATYPGFISIVVPDFAEPHFYDLRKTYVYEYLSATHWRQLEPIEIEARFMVEEQLRSVTMPSWARATAR